jgi:membrane-associated phospholipid phosphatase
MSDVPNPEQNRREFFRRLGAGAVVASSAGILPALASAESRETLKAADLIGQANGTFRALRVYQIREQAARQEMLIPDPQQTNNGDEDRYPNKIASYSKGLPHNNLGEVDPTAYASLTKALQSGNPLDFENVILGGGTKLTNPQSGLAFTMQGPDTHALAIPPAPAFNSAEEAGEIAENYWMALTRDVAFSDYNTSPLTAQAADDMSHFSNFKGPKSGGKVTSATLFRGVTSGDLIGPYISQFFWMPTPFGAEMLDRRMTCTVAGVDFMTDFDSWLAIQKGAPAGSPMFDPTPRYIRNGRDLGQWVHIDVLFEAYFNAYLVLMNLGAPLDAGNPYSRSRTQIGFGTLGSPYMASVLCAVARHAVQAVWYQKWFVHHRLRPEVFAGRVHNHVTGAKQYPINSEILNSSVLTELHKKNRSYLLPMAFPEGSPTHPSYGAGHATVAGACTTVLKAFFDESFVIPSPVQVSSDGLSLQPYSGPSLTVGGELNKIASNVALGRNIAGVHWRSDATESLKLGEELAIRYLREEANCLNEDLKGYALTKFDGTQITV